MMKTTTLIAILLIKISISGVLSGDFKINVECLCESNNCSDAVKRENPPNIVNVTAYDNSSQYGIFKLEWVHDLSKLNYTNLFQYEFNLLDQGMTLDSEELLQNCTLIKSSTVLSYRTNGVYFKKLLTSYRFMMNGRVHVHFEFDSFNISGGIPYDRLWIKPPHIHIADSGVGNLIKLKFQKFLIIKEDLKFDANLYTYGKINATPSISSDTNTTSVEYSIPYLDYSGEYMITLDLVNRQRCKMHERKIKPKCEWSLNFNYTKSPEEVIKVESNYQLSYIFMGTAAVMLSCFLILLIIMMKRRKQNRQIMSAYKNPECNVNNCNVKNKNSIEGILLLYASDCDAFMDLMAQFRTVLENAVGCKVFDIYNNRFMNDLATAPENWIQSKLANNQIKVVIVATDCANILCEATDSNMRYNGNDDYFIDLFKMPNVQNNLVLYTFKSILRDHCAMPYHKFFVTRFPSFTKRTNLIPNINSYKRFDLPQSLNVLVENIILHSQVECNDLNLTKEDEHRLKFNRLITSVSDYVKRHPNYLWDEVLNQGVVLK